MIIDRNEKEEKTSFFQMKQLQIKHKHDKRRTFHNIM